MKKVLDLHKVDSKVVGVHHKVVEKAVLHMVVEKADVLHKKAEVKIGALSPGKAALAVADSSCQVVVLKNDSMVVDCCRMGRCSFG